MTVFTKKYPLVQHSILIHFQASERNKNVCLRASEVKPKLDRFILKKLGGDRDRVISQHNDWIQSKHPNGKDIAFKYRMAISCKGANNIIYKSGKNQNMKLPDIYYGNMNKPEYDQRVGIFFSDDLELTITCFIPDLAKEIDTYIAEFFAVTNFGTMQDKGFGSFTVSNRDCNVAEVLKNNYESKCCYVINIRQRENTEPYSSWLQNELFDTIKQVYSVMKSGQNRMTKNDDGKLVTDCEKYIRSFIYEYMHKKYIFNGQLVNVGNEKAYMKRKEVVPIRTTHELEDEYEHHNQDELADSEFRYVRALLGIGENIEWLEPEDEQADNHREKPYKEKINISDVTYTNEKEKNKNISRIASPIFFKIVRNNIYVTANIPNEEIYGHIFEFTNKGYTKGAVKESPRYGKNIKLTTLNKKEGRSFNMTHFMKEFVEYYNGNLDKLSKKYRIKGV